MSAGNALITDILSEYGSAQPLEYHHQRDFRSEDAVVERAAKYVEKMPSAVSGENGHARTYHVACVLVKGFELGNDQAMSILKEFNARCDPPWSDHELQHKIDDAQRATGQSGYLRNAKPERWDSVAVPEYREPKARQKPAEKVERSKPTRQSLRDAVKQSIEHSATGKKNLMSSLPLRRKQLPAVAFLFEDGAQLRIAFDFVSSLPVVVELLCELNWVNS